MALNQVFLVATEFRFEIAGAVAKNEALRASVERVSDAADRTLISLKAMGAAALTNIVGTTGVAGLLLKAVQSNEKFIDSQLKLQTIIAANRDKLVGPIDSFAGRAAVARNIIKDIAKDANKFSLNQNELFGVTSLLSAQLVGKGLAGRNFGNAREIGRDFLKSAPTLGVDAGLAQGQLLSIIEGRAGLQNTLFVRLSNETKAFAKFAKEGAKSFNTLAAAQRVNLLRRALRQFTSQAEEVEARANTLTQRLQRLKNTIFGLDGVLQPLGAALEKILKQILERFTEIIDKNLRGVIKNFGQVVNLVGTDIEGATVKLMQLSRAAQDFAAAGTLVGLFGLFGIFKGIFGFFAGGGTIGKALGGATTFLQGFSLKAITFTGIMKTGLKILGKIAGPLALAFTAFQTLSRALAIAKLNNIQFFIDLAEKLSGLFARLSNALFTIFQPFDDFIEQIAQALAWFFSFGKVTEAVITGPLEALVFSLERLAEVITIARIGVQGFLAGVAAAIADLIQNGIFKSDLFNSFTKGFIEEGQDIAARALPNGASDSAFSLFKLPGMDTYLSKVRAREGEVDKEAAVTQVTVNGGIKIQNQFKENLQPDRVAFSIKEQLLKTAQNPTQSRQNRTFRRAAATGI